YGRGRAEQFRLHPTTGSALNFAPPLFIIYLLSLVAEPWLGLIWLVPLAAYLALVLIQAIALASVGASSEKSGSTSGGKPAAAGLPRRILRSAAATPLVLVTPILYGLGFWRGLITVLRQPGERERAQVTLEHVT
ncbi:MAG: hypothetical protein ACREIC_32265, partial [Limisphaerales bacterium]